VVHGLDYKVAIALFVVLAVSLIASLFTWQWRQSPSQKAIDDKYIENLRIIYGSWLVVGALLVTLAVLVVTLSAVDTQSKVTDIVAIIASVTGVMGTLTAAFFGIQQAAAGRSQAMSTLTQLKGQGIEGAAPYQSVAPDKLEPSFGPHAGGTQVSISGNGFKGANAVNFGVGQGTNFQFVNDGLIRATTPAAAKGANDVQVIVAFPDSTPNRVVGAFSYYTIEPSQGPAATPVTIRGSNLKGVSAVKFGSEDGKDLAHNADRSLSVKAPAMTAKAEVDVDVICYAADARPSSSWLVSIITPPLQLHPKAVRWCQHVRHAGDS
jgi:hypothetical protein